MSSRYIAKFFEQIKEIIELAIKNPKTVFGVLFLALVIVFLITNPQILTRNGNKNETTKEKPAKEEKVLDDNDEKQKSLLCHIYEEDKGEWTMPGCKGPEKYENGSEYFVSKPFK